MGKFMLGGLLCSVGFAGVIGVSSPSVSPAVSTATTMQRMQAQKRQQASLSVFADDPAATAAQQREATPPSVTTGATSGGVF